MFGLVRWPPARARAKTACGRFRLPTATTSQSESAVRVQPLVTRCVDDSLPLRQLAVDRVMSDTAGNVPAKGRVANGRRWRWRHRLALIQSYRRASTLGACCPPGSLPSVVAVTGKDTSRGGYPVVAAAHRPQAICPPSPFTQRAATRLDRVSWRGVQCWIASLDILRHSRLPLCRSTRW